MLGLKLINASNGGHGADGITTATQNSVHISWDIIWLYSAMCVYTLVALFNKACVFVIIYVIQMNLRAFKYFKYFTSFTLAFWMIF